MKFLALALAMLAVPLAGMWCRERPSVRYLLLAILGFLPFTGEAVAMNLIVDEHYHGDSIGLEVTLFDLVAGVLLVAQFGSRSKSPYALARWSYVGWAMLSLLGAALPMYGLFSVWKLLRMFLALRVVSTEVRRPRAGPALLRGFMLGVVYVTLTALDQRYLQGILRCRGALPHSNTLGMAVNLMAPIALALLLVRQGGVLAALAVACAAVCDILSQSRVCLLMFALAGVVVFCGSLARQFQGRKLAVLLSFVAAGTVAGLYSADAIIERVERAPKESAEARVHFNEAAKLMVGDHPVFGIGINQYSHVLATDGYADAVGVLEVDRHGVAHQIYWLTIAELGIPGLLIFLWVLGGPLWRAARSAWTIRDVRGDILLGIAAGLGVSYLQGLTEWVFRQTEVGYLFFSLAGLAASLSVRRR